MDPKLIRAIQHYTARAAIGGSSMRNAGSKGVVGCAQEFLKDMPLRSFGTSSESKFRKRLDDATERLRHALPKKARHWGLARKGVNIFLRNCLYTTYLRDAYELKVAERFFEVPLDSYTGDELFEQSGRSLPRWKSVRGLRPEISAQYQAVAATIAAQEGFARVHLDALWWGKRED